jgi:hypothetical protein
MRHLLAVVALGLAVAFAPAHAQEVPTAPNAPERPSPAPSAQGLKACLSRPDAGNCLDALFRDFLLTHTTVDALAVVERLGQVDADLRLVCHPVVHAIGRETFRLKKTIHESFAACDQTCHSGCYHGAIERFIRGEAVEPGIFKHISIAELENRAVQACDATVASRFRFQCLHGLGHALMYFSGYKLTTALGVCDKLSDRWSQSSCYGGVFMENVFSATPERRDVSRTDYHYPCAQVDPKYGADCYINQTWRMAEMGLSTERLFDECRRAGQFRGRCMQSIGRDLSNDVRSKDPRLAAEKCELGTGEDRHACIRGVVFALIDNTWDGRYALPFCVTLRAGGDVGYCFGQSTQYLRTTFEKSPLQVADECGRYAAEMRACLDSTSR